MAGTGVLPAAANAAAPGTLTTRPIPSTGAELPVVGCGTWQTFDVGTDRAARDHLEEVLRILFAGGGTVIDSSPMYGSSEAVVGDLLARMNARDRAFLATKVWTDGAAQGRAQMEQSFARFHTERIELMQVHNLVDWRTQLRTLREWKEAGRFRYIGITHYTTSAFDEMTAIMRTEPLDFVQIPYSVTVRDAERDLLPLAMDRGIAVIANRSFGGGNLFGRVRNRALPGFAAEYGIESWAQFFLKFVLGHPALTCVIPGTGRPDYMRDNLGAGRGPQPDAQTRERMASVMREL